MSERDYNRQVVKRQRIGRATLVVGVDIGNACNAVGFMDKEGNVLGSCAKLYNSREGFEQFVKMTEGLKTKHRLKDVLIGMEPTGHYWRKLAYFAKDQGYEVRFVRTTALKHHRELDESSSAKSDKRDASPVVAYHQGYLLYESKLLSFYKHFASRLDYLVVLAFAF
jgi:transposase